MENNTAVPWTVWSRCHRSRPGFRRGGAGGGKAERASQPARGALGQGVPPGRSRLGVTPFPSACREMTRSPSSLLEPLAMLLTRLTIPQTDILAHSLTSQGLMSVEPRLHAGLLGAAAGPRVQGTQHPLGAGPGIAGGESRGVQRPPACPVSHSLEGRSQDGLPSALTRSPLLRE